MLANAVRVKVQEIITARKLLPGRLLFWHLPEKGMKKSLTVEASPG
jgi:hypothetical protein